MAAIGPALPVGEREPSLRMTDAERERVVETLRRAGADGRLDTDELEERVARAYTARRWADAAPLIEDLGARRAVAES